MQIISLCTSVILQVIIFSLIPFIWWFFTDRKNSRFLKWLGFKKPQIEEKIAFTIWLLLTIIILLVPAFVIVPLFVDQSNMATSQFLGKGIPALIPSIIYAFIQTGLSEEIFFRGFLNKRLINKFGLTGGNIIQGLLFGLVHGLMFLSIAGIVGAMIISLVTGVAGGAMGLINEKLSKGSIVPSWLIHGCCNLLASIIAMFSLI